jgi:hypothetical protein
MKLPVTKKSIQTYLIFILSNDRNSLLSGLISGSPILQSIHHIQDADPASLSWLWLRKTENCFVMGLVTLNSPISVPHSNFLEPIFVLIMRINVGHFYFPNHPKSLTLMWEILFYFCRKLMCVTILFYVTFVLKLLLKVLVRSLQEDLWKDPGPWPTLFPP